MKYDIELLKEEFWVLSLIDKINLINSLVEDGYLGMELEIYENTSSELEGLFACDFLDFASAIDRGMYDFSHDWVVLDTDSHLISYTKNGIVLDYMKECEETIIDGLLRALTEGWYYLNIFDHTKCYQVSILKPIFDIMEENGYSFEDKSEDRHTAIMLTLHKIWEDEEKHEDVCGYAHDFMKATKEFLRGVK